MGKLITFTVKVVDEVGKKTTTRWLTADRTWSPDETDAVVFTRPRAATNRQQIVINEECHDIIGGFRKWIDLTSAEADLWERLADKYVREVWPPEAAPGGGERSTRPAAATEAEAAAQWALIEARWNEDRSSLAAGLREMRRQASRVRFMAAWRHLIVKPPAGWESLADMPDDPPGLLDLLMLAYDLAVAEAEKTLGN